ncbi:Protein CHUP1 chloroplastic [Melia azedarach]|uniref:Protein CHUP1 chloroplastic n=1 Tax=Melia azedarach TaxID=155640 RepID=A0ACC1XRF9_MELAZ|nr:Protein CHUP1 chloroplastic [Melia azedarach]
MAAIDMLNGAIDSFQDEVKLLQEEKRQVVSANVELETAKMMLHKLQMKMDSNPMNMKGQLVLLEQQVSRFLCSKETSINSDKIQKKLKAARRVELEFVEMQRMNKELELEKRKLTLNLVDAKARTKALSYMTQIYKESYGN